MYALYRACTPRATARRRSGGFRAYLRKAVLMLDAPLRRLIDRPLAALGRAVVWADMPAHAVTLLGLCFAFGCFAALAMSFYKLALALMLLNRFLDGLDGAAARASPGGATAFGGYIDILSDFLFYGGFVFFFALGHPDNAVAASFLLFSFLLMGGSFFAGAAIAEKCAPADRDRGGKSSRPMPGLAEGTETTIAFILVCLFPHAFKIVAVLFGLLCLATTALRVAQARKEFGPFTRNGPVSETLSEQYIPGRDE
jgi:phosphatidylglycerophosphate synthase